MNKNFLEPKRFNYIYNLTKSFPVKDILDANIPKEELNFVLYRTGQGWRAI